MPVRSRGAPMNPVLVAGIGNPFHGDDGFGLAVAQRLALASLPEGVDVVEFGIRGMDLAFALTGGYRLAVLIDTVQRGESPGTLYVIEPQSPEFEAQDGAVSPHQIDPASVLRMTRLLGGACAQVLVIGCEPASFGDAEEGHVGLSDEVGAAIERAAAMAAELIDQWLRQQNSTQQQERIQ
jgi:hydrogenase maturation protease